MVVGYMLAIGVVLRAWVHAQMDQSQNARAVRADLLPRRCLVCTVATGFPVLLAGRIVQGISTGIVLPHVRIDHARISTV